jgi:hypothetical protein
MLSDHFFDALRPNTKVDALWGGQAASTTTTMTFMKDFQTGVRLVGGQPIDNPVQGHHTRSSCPNGGFRGMLVEQSCFDFTKGAKIGVKVWSRQHTDIPNWLESCHLLGRPLGLFEFEGEPGIRTLEGGNGLTGQKVLNYLIEIQLMHRRNSLFLIG